MNEITRFSSHISQVVCEIPSNLCMRHFGASKWIGGIMIAWGLVMICMITVRNRTGLFIARFFLGFAEAGFFPGVIFYLTLWYPRQYQASRMAIFFSGALLAGAIGGLLAYGVARLNGKLGLNGWQWIFLSEGVLTIVFGIVALKVLVDYPNDARWLHQCHKDILLDALRADMNLFQDVEDGLSWKTIKSTFKDWKVWIYLLVNFGAVTPVFSFSSFLPSIINNIGYHETSAQLLIAPIYLVSCLTTYASSWSASYYNERGCHILIGILIGMSGFLYLMLCSKLLYIGAVLAAIGVFSSNALVLSWLTCNINGKTKRAVAVSSVVAAGSLGGIFSGQIYRQSDTPSYHQGHSIMFGFLCFEFATVLALKIFLTRENRKRVPQKQHVNDEEQHLISNTQSHYNSYVT